MSNTFELNQKLELEMINNGQSRYNKRTYKNVEKENESANDYGTKLLASTIRAFSTGIINFLEASKEKKKGATPVAVKKMQDGIDPEVLAMISARQVINSISQTRPLTATAITLGTKIEDELALDNFRKVNPRLFKVVKKDLDERSNSYSYKRKKLRESAINDGVEWESWTTPDKLQVGLRLIEIMIETTGLCEIVKRKKRGRLTNMLQATEKTMEWIKNRNAFNSLLQPEYMPTVHKPKAWEGSKGGGYYTRDLKPLELVKIRNKNFLKELDNFEMPKVYRAINAMQDTPYKINNFILEVMQTCWDRSWAIGGLPSSDNLPLPNKPHDIDTNKEAREEYKRLSVIAHTENARLISQRLLVSKNLFLADKYKDFDALYFPLQMDFRQRVYTVPAFLSYQGSDYSKALLTFAKGKPITADNGGVYWLCIHGANCFGVKGTLDERYEWVNENKKLICSYAQDPFGNLGWADADEPFQFLAFAKELANYLTHGDGYVCSLPVSSDGTCNGLQHYSAMLRDSNGAYYTNLTPTDRPQDIYQVIADKVIEKLKKDISNNPFASLWLQYGINRSITKRSVMTLPYSSTRFASTDFVLEEIQKRKDNGQEHPFGKDTLKPASYLAGVIWDSIGDTLSSAFVGMKWLKAVARVVAKKQLPITWITPTGFPVFQQYSEMKSKRVRATLFGEVIKPRIMQETDLTDPYKMASGVAPNFVHSMDSSAMILAVNEALDNGITSFCNVHDSFGTLPTDMELLNKCIRKTFVDMYQNNDVLQQFKDQVSTVLDDDDLEKIPEVPTKGALELNQVLESDYFFN